MNSQTSLESVGGEVIIKFFTFVQALCPVPLARPLAVGALPQTPG
jgi:hypothetical protein